MQMLRCIDCGKIFDDDDVAVWEESRGEFWGVPCSETVSGCPHCQGDYEQVTTCKRCDKWCSEDELTNGYCDLCYDELFN